MFTNRFQTWVRRRAQALAGWLGRLPITPNQVTVAGVAVAFFAAGLVATGNLLVGGVVLALGGTFDILDGALARATKRSYPFGAFLDSTTDRYSEAAIYLGIVMFFLGRPNPRPAVVGAILAIIGSLLVSYVRARAQSLGFKCESGLFARPERVVATVAGLVLGASVLFWVVWVLAVLTNVTAAQRIFEVWGQAREQRRVREKATAPILQGSSPETGQ